MWRSGNKAQLGLNYNIKSEPDSEPALSDGQEPQSLGPAPTLADCKLSRYFRWQRINCRLTWLNILYSTARWERIYGRGWSSRWSWSWSWLFGHSFQRELRLGEKLNEADNGRPNPFRALPDYIMQAASRVTAERVFQRFYLLPRVQR